MCLIALALVLCQGSSTQDLAVPVELQVPLLAKVLHFDRNLRDQLDQEVVVLVAYQSSYRASRDMSEQLAAHLRSAGLHTVHGKPIRWIPFDLESSRSLAQELRNRRVQVLYLAPLRTLDVATLTGAASSIGVLSVTSVPEYMRRGAAVGFGARGSKPTILINLEAARAAGAEFGSQLLHVAQIMVQ